MTFQSGKHSCSNSCTWNIKNSNQNFLHTIDELSKKLYNILYESPGVPNIFIVSQSRCYFEHLSINPLKRWCSVSRGAKGNPLIHLGWKEEFLSSHLLSQIFIGTAKDTKFVW